MSYKLTIGVKMWKGNGNIPTPLFSLKRLEIVNQERRGQVKTIVIEHFNGILYHMSEPTNKQQTNYLQITYLICWFENKCDLFLVFLNERVYNLSFLVVLT